MMDHLPRALKRKQRPISSREYTDSHVQRICYAHVMCSGEKPCSCSCRVMCNRKEKVLAGSNAILTFVAAKTEIQVLQSFSSQQLEVLAEFTSSLSLCCWSCMRMSFVLPSRWRSVWHRCPVMFQQWEANHRERGSLRLARWSAFGRNEHVHVQYFHIHVMSNQCI